MNAGHTGKLTNLQGNSLYDHDGKNNANPYQVEHDMLFDAVVKGEYKFADAENGAKSTMTSILGRYATYSGKPVTWEEGINSDIDLSPDRLAWDAMPKVLPKEDGYYPHAIPGQTKVV